MTNQQAASRSHHQFAPEPQLEQDAPNIASLRSLYRRRDTLNQHQQWARECLGLNYPTDHQIRMLYTRMKEQAQQALSIDALTQFGARWLYRAKLVIPPERSLHHEAVCAFIESEDETLDILETLVTKQDLQTWIGKLYERA